MGSDGKVYSRNYDDLRLGKKPLTWYSPLQVSRSGDASRQSLVNSSINFHLVASITDRGGVLTRVVYPCQSETRSQSEDVGGVGATLMRVLLQHFKTCVHFTCYLLSHELSSLST